MAHNVRTLPSRPSRRLNRRRPMLLKACPRCGGDLVQEPDDAAVGEMYACLQCGWRGEL